MESQPQHDQHITMCPQHAAEPFLPALRAGAEQAVDFEALIAAALQYGTSEADTATTRTGRCLELFECCFGMRISSFQDAHADVLCVFVR